MLTVECVVTFLHDTYIVMLAAPVLFFASDMLPVQSFCDETGNAALVGLSFWFLLSCL